MVFPPVVYAGPSIAADDIQQLLPGAQRMPPIARGDLYRDRTLGFSVFVILDGVFSQQLAIPPREVLDVLADGACVIGASSMGAIRAAECWPAGMQGVGTIYRLFRRGVLESDDEVALTFMEDAGYRVASVPLINIRFSVSRHLRRGQLDGDQARRIIGAAGHTRYPQRNWRALLEAAEIEDSGGELRRSLAACDLKRTDAQRALRRTERLIRTCALPAPGPASGGLRLPGKHSRERAHHATDGLDPQLLKTGLWQWLIASGRYQQLECLSQVIDLGAPQPSCPDELWEVLLADPATDSLVYRYRALRLAVHRARELALTADEACRQQAEASIASGHAAPDFKSLLRIHGQSSALCHMLEALRQDLALAFAFKKVDTKHVRG